MSAPNRPYEPPANRPHFKHWPSRLPRHLTLPETSLWFNLEVAARRFPHKPMYLFLGRTHTFSQIHAQARAVAGWLQSVGVKRGDRVMLCMQNCPQFGIAYYGILHADAVVVPVNPMNRADELGHYIIDPDVKVAICTVDVAAAIDQANMALGQPQRLQHMLVTRYTDAMSEGPLDPQEAVPLSMETWLRGDPAVPAYATRWVDAIEQQLEPGPHLSGPDDLAVLPYTSGTTGLPKGCMHTHRTLMHNTLQGVMWTCGTTESVNLGVVPMFHITGMMYALNSPVFGGSTTVLLPRWDRELAGRSISRYRVTHWTCIPTMVIDLFASPNYASFDLSSLLFISGGGTAMPKAVAVRLEQQYGLRFAEGYGLTETAAPTHTNPPEASKQQCLGIPVVGVDSVVIDPLTLKEVPIGETGEIVVHGPNVFKGYWRHPEATKQSFVEIDGLPYFRTGDLGRMDEDGYFFITDRLKRMINASGFKVWPAEVEMLLYKHPAVLEACIIAARDAYRGETVKAFIVLRPEAQGKVAPEEITAWSREHMAAYKVPKLVEFVESLPKSGTGKVMWRQLQDEEAAKT